MARSSQNIAAYLEVGKKRTFAGALDWPGWCRSGRDEASALQALLDAGPRYAHALGAAGLALQAPVDTSAFAVVERLAGTTTTDFGAPDVAPAYDTQPAGDADIVRLQTLLRASWQAFDAAVSTASGKALRMGPRGGGRDVEGIARHVMGAERGYLARLARKVPQPDAEDLGEQIERTRQAVLDALAAAVRGELPERGPRGGVIWAPRYFVRRVAWHVLDHAWEIEDRVA